MARERTLQPAETLAVLGHEYHHIQQEHQREPEGNAVRRRQRERMERIAQRFERLVTRWVRDDELAAAWRRFLYEATPPPDGPTLREPPLFRGHTPSGALIEVYQAVGGDYDILIDGAHVDRDGASWNLEPDEIAPTLVAGEECREVFDSSPEAIAALEEFLAGGQPPWQFGVELFEDGLIDADFGLTARGRRRLNRVPPRAGAAALRGATRYVVLAADAARARLFTLEVTEPPDEPTVAPLIEVADLTSPAARTRDSELLAESRPGTRSEGWPRTSPVAGRPPPGAQSGHAVDDRRDSRRRESDRNFAEIVADEVARLWRVLGDCEVVVVAGPGMLGFLRPAIERRNQGPSARPVHELSRNLTWLEPPALHDALAQASLLPARGRLPPTPGAHV